MKWVNAVGKKGADRLTWHMQLGSVAHVYTNCLKAIAVAARLVQTSVNLTLNSGFCWQSPQADQSLLNSELT